MILEIEHCPVTRQQFMTQYNVYC